MWTPDTEGDTAISCHEMEEDDETRLREETACSESTGIAI